MLRQGQMVTITGGPFKGQRGQVRLSPQPDQEVVLLMIPRWVRAPEGSLVRGEWTYGTYWVSLKNTEEA